MPQQINLLDASLQRQRATLASITTPIALIALVATLGVSATLTLVLQAMSSQALAQAHASEQAVAALRTRVAQAGQTAPAPGATELARLRAVEAGQRRLRAAIDSGQAGTTQCYTGYLLALSRQTQPGLWLTGFSVAPDGRALEISGRMTDPRQLPDYLRRLNGEALFKGREFAQLSLTTVTPAAASDSALRTGYTEFALRSAAVGSNSSSSTPLNWTEAR